MSQSKNNWPNTKESRDRLCQFPTNCRWPTCTCEEDEEDQKTDAHFFVIGVIIIGAGLVLATIGYFAAG